MEMLGLEIQGKFLYILIYAPTHVNCFKTIKQFCYLANTSLNSQYFSCLLLFG